jgi:hypothetical protein
MNERFETVDTRLDHLDARVGRIEADVHALCDEMVHPPHPAPVQDWISHASIKNTVIYAQLTSRRRDEEARKVFASQYVV